MAQRERNILLKGTFRVPAREVRQNDLQEEQQAAPHTGKALGRKLCVYEHREKLEVRKLKGLIE